MPKPGWVEHDASEIWKKSGEVIRGALRQANLLASDLAAIGITNQRETIVAWDVETGAPLHNAIIWQDTRTAEDLNRISAEDSKKITALTGLPVSPYFSASKIAWLMTHCSDLQGASARGTARVGTIDSWLLWNLTGGPRGGIFATDVTNASRTLLMDIEKLEWSKELLALFNIPPHILPEIKSSSQIYGQSDAQGPLGAHVPIASILGDQQAAMVGQMAFNRGDSKTTYGTGNFALLNTGREIVRSEHGLLTTVCYQFGDQPVHYALEGSVAVTGSAIQWLRDQLGIITHASETEGLAASVPDTAGIYFVPAFSGLFAPYWRSDARGVIVGLTRATTKSHLARAALEAICYQTRDVIDAMAADCGIPLAELRVDGGITANSLCMQMQADILGVDVVRPLNTETTALGAAYAAGLAIGYWKDIQELEGLWQLSRRWSPTSTVESREIGYQGWKKAIERTLNWA